MSEESASSRENREKRNMCLNFCLWAVLCAGAMTVMLIFAANKTIVIADKSSEQSVSGGNALGESGIPQGRSLAIDRTTEMTGSFSVPLPKGVKAENIVVENRYMSGELWLYIQCEDADFFAENALTGDTGFIQEGSFGVQDEQLVLRLKMQKVLEYRSTMENNRLMIAFYEPWELYDYIIVIDPVGGGDREEPADTGLSEQEVSLAVAKQVQKNFEMSNVRLYLTRTEDINVPEESRLALLDEVKADVYIGIGASVSEENPNSYGILCRYNEEYFIPDFGNVQLADIVTREVTIASSNRAEGLLAAKDDEMLSRITVPAVKLSVGYLSNSQEQALLRQESYREKLANGVLTAIEKICQELDEWKKEQR